ncbi:MAG: hypothetical protein ACW99L_08000 [Promethearchaeota archaeon]|jgi:hypothetical protein
MILNWFWATLPSEVGRSVFDFFSFGHLAMGIVVFSLLSLISTIRNLFDSKNFKVKKSHWIWFVVGTIAFAVFWEIVENTLVYDWGLKHMNQRDSIINAIADIILGGLSALLLWAVGYLLYEKVKKYEFLLFYLFAVLMFVVFFVIYLVLEF